ncbi:hypothetical protein ES705_38020 [subsurface metagenome]
MFPIWSDNQRPRKGVHDSTVGTTGSQAFGENVRLVGILGSCQAIFGELGIHLL